MELRRCSHLHFIQAIKSGGVEKVSNVDYRGRPGLVFKGLKDIYDSEDKKRRSNYSTHQSVDEFNNTTGSSNVKREIKKRKLDFGIFDHEFGNDITLKQLKKGSKAKKRKVIDSDDVIVEQEEDESDLMETINSWKSKIFKNSKGKKKNHKKKCAQNQNQEKSKPIPSSVSGGLGLPLTVKVEVSETEYSEPIRIYSETCDSSVNCSEICVVNDVCYDQFKDIDDVFTNYQKMPFPQLADSPFIENEEDHTIIYTPSAEETSDLHTDDSVLEMYKLANQISEVELPGIAREPTASDLYESNDDINKELHLDYEVPIDSVDCSVAIEEEKCVSSLSDVGLNDSSDRNQSNDSIDGISIPGIGNYSHMGPWRSPERLLSTRKVISPTSQERLCQAMKGVELIEDDAHFKCKEKLHFENTTGKEPLRKEQSVEYTNVDTPLEELGAANARKVIIRPKNNTNKKASPPKSNKKSPNITRSLPNFSTGTKSLQRCTESAILFSQRQMHDFESLATKLMQELSSMKGIIEGELHCETTPTKTLKCDVDEVKMAIKSARKAEETTKKWLSMMTKDCNRFCTIMKLIEKGEVASPNNTHKERRKITFADEAGGVLCHVKVFEDGFASPDSQM